VVACLLAGAILLLFLTPIGGIVKVIGGIGALIGAVVLAVSAIFNFEDLRTTGIKLLGAVALVAPNGTVKSVEVKGGHPLLAEAAQNALRQWKFEPASHETSEFVEIQFAP